MILKIFIFYYSSVYTFSLNPFCTVSLSSYNTFHSVQCSNNGSNLLNVYVCMLLFLIPNSLSLRSDALITRVSSMCIVVSSYYIIIFSIRIIVNVRSSSSASISSFIPVLLINIISSEAPSPLPPCIQHQISQEQPYRCLLHHHLIRNTLSPFQLFFCLLFVVWYDPWQRSFMYALCS